MKILHFSTWQTGGAAKAAERLSSALIELGHDSKVVHMTSRLPAYFDTAIGKLTNDYNPIFHSYNYFPDNFRQIIKKESPDIIHIHWIGAGFVRPESLANCPVPIVWTLHDLWPLLGAEHLPLSITRMQDGYSSSNRPQHESGLDLNKLVWNRKRRVFTKKHINFISPSQANYDLAKKAKLISTHNHVLISNFVDNNLFKPNLNKVEPYTIFCPSMNMDVDQNKGIDLLILAIKAIDPSLRSKIKLILAGTSTIPIGIAGSGVTVENMGMISDEAKMENIYQRSAAVVVPSRLENLPYVVLESLSCGTPVVAFNVGGIPELVVHNKTGYLAKPYDIADLATGITKILSDQILRQKLSSNGILHIKNNFSKAKIVTEHLVLYNSLLNR